jgi:hypothetical protein
VTTIWKNILIFLAFLPAGLGRVHLANTAQVNTTAHITSDTRDSAKAPRSKRAPLRMALQHLLPANLARRVSTRGPSAKQFSWR